MKRSQLLQLLHDYIPSPDELLAKQQIIDFVTQHPHCFERSLLTGHITASAWLLSKDHSKALLMHHAKLNKWVQLGGHCDGESDVLAVAIKEAQEESGIQHIAPVSSQVFDIDVHFIPANPKEPAHYHYDIRFLLAVTSDEAIIQNHESKELRWVSKNKADLPTNGISVTRMLNKWLETY